MTELDFDTLLASEGAKYPLARLDGVRATWAEAAAYYDARQRAREQIVLVPVVRETTDEPTEDCHAAG